MMGSSKIPGAGWMFTGLVLMAFGAIAAGWYVWSGLFWLMHQVRGG